MKIQWPNQFAHMLFGTSILLGRVVWFPRNCLATVILLFGLVLYAAFKEFVWDEHIAKSQDYEGAATDFMFYSIGIVATAIALGITGKI